ncbi:MAG: flagellar motor protein MotB [Caldilineaceae bacterium]|nr:flagellar motor protein MotB [Caldilineaceae bacterium]HRJ43640.1 flagellar motor protein MotB [Caldilineaceae bacterium]
MGRKPQVIKEFDTSKRWLETFSDLMSLLLVFFILLFAFGQADLERFRLLSGSLRAAFSGVDVFSGGLGFGEGFDSTGNQEANANMLNLGALPTRDKTFQKVANEINQHALTNQLEDQIAINIGKEGIYISLSSALLYPSGSTELGESGKQTLLTIANLLNELPNNIRVEAHTDDTATGSPIYATNWDLSSARAVSVVRFLADNGAVDPQRMSAVGLAEYHPLYPNDTPEHRRLNRRADILILYPPEEEAPIIDLGFPSASP